MLQENPNKLFGHCNIKWGGSDGKEYICNEGDLGLIPGLGRSPEERNGNPLQYSCLRKSMDREAWQAIAHEVAKESDIT